MKSFSSLCVLLLFCVTALAQKQNAKTDSIVFEYNQSQRYNEALNLLIKTYPEPVNNQKIISQLAYAAKMANKLPEAEGYYQRLYTKDSSNLQALFNLAAINSQLGRTQAAIGFYKHILAIDSNNFNTYKQLALISASRADVPAQTIYLQKANEINPIDPDVAYNLSGILIGLKQLPQAQKIIEAALTADTSNLILLKGKARVSYTLPQYPETIEICKRLLANLDKSNQVVTYKGVSEFNLKRYKDCINTFSLLDTTGDQTETSYYYTGISYKALGNNNNAILYLQKAIKEGISSNTGDYYSEIADSYEKLHLPKIAVAAYQRALTFEEKPLAIYSLASVYDTGLRDTLNALKYYKKYLRTKPPIDKQHSYIEYSNRRIMDLSR